MKLIKCPKHKDITLHQLKFWDPAAKKTAWCGWWYCSKCDMPFKMKYELQAAEGDVI